MTKQYLFLYDTINFIRKYTLTSSLIGVKQSELSKERFCEFDATINMLD